MYKIYSCEVLRVHGDCPKRTELVEGKEEEGKGKKVMACPHIAIYRSKALVFILIKKTSYMCFPTE